MRVDEAGHECLAADIDDGCSKIIDGVVGHRGDGTMMHQHTHRAAELPPEKNARVSEEIRGHQQASSTSRLDEPWRGSRNWTRPRGGKANGAFRRMVGRTGGDRARFPGLAAPVEAAAPLRPPRSTRG